jgi:hypothetical protein
VTNSVFAVIVLLLALSPFTAPFQTCSAGQAIAVAANNDDDGPGSIVAPVVPKTGHTPIAAPLLTSDGYRNSCAPLPPVSVGAKTVQHRPLRSTHLRI